MNRQSKRVGSPGRIVWGLAVITLAAHPVPVRSQGTRTDYERAARLSTLVEGKVFLVRVEPNWLPGNNRFWYRNDLADGKHEFILADAPLGFRRPAFDHKRLAAALSERTAKTIAFDRLPIDDLWFDDNNTLLQFTADKRWECSLATYKLREADQDKRTALPRLPQARPTQRTGPETSITFVNQTAKQVEVFWIDAEGRHKPYGVLAAGERRRQHTF